MTLGLAFTSTLNLQMLMDGATGEILPLVTHWTKRTSREVPLTFPPSLDLSSAHELAALGGRLFIIGRRGPEIADAARTIGRGTVGVQADVSNLTNLDRLYEQISWDAGTSDTGPF
jgi:hypothetical protein